MACWLRCQLNSSWYRWSMLYVIICSVSYSPISKKKLIQVYPVSRDFVAFCYKAQIGQYQYQSMKRLSYLFMPLLHPYSCRSSVAKIAKTTAVDKGFAIRIWENAGVFTDMLVSEINHVFCVLAKYYSEIKNCKQLPSSSELLNKYGQIQWLQIQTAAGKACEVALQLECNKPASNDWPFGEWMVSICPAHCDKTRAMCFCGEGTKYPNRPVAEYCGFQTM